MLPYLSSKYFFTLLQEALTIKQHKKRLSSVEKKVALAAALFFRRQLQARRKPVTSEVPLGTLATALLGIYLLGARYAKLDYALAVDSVVIKERAKVWVAEHSQVLLDQLNVTTANDIATLQFNSSTELDIAKLFVGYGTKRAKLIAATETNLAYQSGIYGAILVAAGTGLDYEKSWLPVDEACPICVTNSDEHWIAFGAEHASGDLYPPAHGNCRCTELYRLIP